MVAWRAQTWHTAAPSTSSPAFVFNPSTRLHIATNEPEIGPHDALSKKDDILVHETAIDNPSLYSVSSEPTLAHATPVVVCSDEYSRYSHRGKLAILSIITAAAATSPMSTNIYFPAQENLIKTLGISQEAVSISITTYIIAQAIAPCFWGPLSDHYGRRFALIASLVICIAATVGLALVQDTATLLALRALQAVGSSSTISMGSGVIADIAAPSERGGFNGTFAGVRQIAVGVGPLLGGLLASTAIGFRAIFWFLTAWCALTALLVALLMPETKKDIVWDANKGCRRWLYSAFLPFIASPPAVIDHTAAARPRTNFSPMLFLDPIRFCFQRDVVCALTFGACIYTVSSMSTACLSRLMVDNYHFNTWQIGLCYIPFGIGCVLGSKLCGRQLDVSWRRESLCFNVATGAPDPLAPVGRKSIPTNFPLERSRLADMPLYSATMVLGLLIFGWSLDPHSRAAPLNANFFVPLVGQLLIGFSSTAVLGSNQTLLQDLFPTKGASVGAATNLVRGLPAAVGVAFVQPLIDAIGIGWASVAMVGVVVLGLGPVWITLKKGQAWRQGREESRRASEASTVVGDEERDAEKVGPVRGGFTAALAGSLAAPRLP